MIGERVGNYVITHQLGEGGMGMVYQAEHPQIGKKVALKILHAELANSQDVVTRFFHEAKAVNDIEHPNIVDILDFGQVPSANGQLVYLVMELLSGNTLSTVIETEQLSPQRATHIAVQVADALAASHDRGIVHRDLKPDNIMLIRSSRDPDFVKLLDFGIAKMTGTGSTSKTRTGMVMGTPTHMSPEQCEGRGNRDHRTDIYALGIVMYQMLTGTVPFTGAGYGEILVKQMTEAPAPPSAHRPGIPPHLEQIVLKALQKRPSDRFQSMRDIVAALSDPNFAFAGTSSQATIVATASPSHAAKTRVASLSSPPPMQQNANPTTLSGSAGQMTAFAPAPTPMTAPGTMMTRKSKAPLLAVGVVVLAAVGIIAVVATKKDEPTETAAADPQPEPTPTPDPAPPPAPAPAPAPAPTPAPPPQPTTIKLSVETEPKGAEVFFADESKARCTTPCDFTEARSDKSATLTIKLAGHTEETRTVKLDADARLDVELAETKKTVARRPESKKKSEPKVEPKTDAKKVDQKKAPVGDNTLNPFDN